MHLAKVGENPTKGFIDKRGKRKQTADRLTDGKCKRNRSPADGKEIEMDDEQTGRRKMPNQSFSRWLERNRNG